MHIKVLRQRRTWLDVQLEADPSGCHLETEQSRQSGGRRPERAERRKDPLQAEEQGHSVYSRQSGVHVTMECAQSGEVRLHRLQPAQPLNQEGPPRRKAWKLQTSSHLSFPICVMEVTSLYLRG